MDPTTNSVYSSASSATGSTNGNTYTPACNLGWETNTSLLATVPSGTVAALSLSGTNAIITSVPGIVGPGNPKSIAAWINIPAGFNEAGTVVGWGPNTSGQRWDLRVQKSGGLGPFLKLETSGGNFYGAINLADGLWHHVAVTYGTTITVGGINYTTGLYVDGVLDTANNLAPTATPTTQLNILIGDSWAVSSTTYNSRKFTGMIDDVRIYDHGLSLTEIQVLAGLTAPASVVSLTDQQMTLGSTNPITFTPVTGGTPPLQFQWYFTDQANRTTNLMVDPTNASLTIYPANSPGNGTNLGTYRVTVSNIQGGAIASANLVLATPPVAPATQVALDGTPATFAVTGLPTYQTYSYQWTYYADTNLLGGTVTNLINNKGQASPMSVSWSDSTRQLWGGPFTVAKGDAAMLNGFGEAAGTTNVTVTVSGIPANYQSAGYSVYVYMGEPSADAGIVNSYDTFGEISLGAVTNYYHALDLAFWDGGFYPAVTTDPNDSGPSNANYAVFDNLSGPSVSFTVAPHPVLGGPASVSGFQIVANAPRPSLGISLSGTNLVLTWSPGFLGYRLLEQTNNLDHGVSVNLADWMGVEGSAATNARTIPISQTNRNDYYRLVYP